MVYDRIVNVADLALDDLRCFLAVAKTLNFRRAASTVSLTPAAVGQRVRKLESALGQTLFERTTRSVALTPIGTSLVPAAETCLHAAEECLRVSLDRPLPTELLLGTRHELGLSWLVPELARLRRELPWLKLNLYFGSAPDLVSRVRGHLLDCSISSSRFSDLALQTIDLHREDYVLVLSPKLAKAQPLRSPADAETHTLLDIDPQLPLFRYFRDSPGAPELRFRDISALGTTSAIRHEVLRGEGVAVLPLYLVEKDLATGKLCRAYDKLDLQSDFFRLIFRENDRRKPAYESLAAHLRAVPLR